MKKEISSKFVVLTFGILTILFLTGFYIYAWQEPSQTAPNSNVAVPINTGSAAQSKTGRISAPEFYDANDSNYYLNPNGNSNLNTVCLGTDCRNAWPNTDTLKMSASSYLSNGVYYSKTVFYTCPSGTTASLASCTNCGTIGGAPLCVCSAASSTASLTVYIGQTVNCSCTGGNWECVWGGPLGLDCLSTYQTPRVCDTCYNRLSTCTTNCRVYTGSITFMCGVERDVTPP